MKVWVKGAIVGALWGMVSGIYGFALIVASNETGREFPEYYYWLLWPFFYNLFNFFGFLNDVFFGGPDFIHVGWLIISPMVNGAIILTSIKFLIGKYIK